MAKVRAGEAGEAELEANAGRLKTKEWPYAVIELYLGKRSPTATLDAAVKLGDRCEPQFYIGQWHILKASKAEAEAALKVAVEICPKMFGRVRSGRRRTQTAQAVGRRSPGARLSINLASGAD